MTSVHRSSRPRPRGLTLPELIISGALFIALSALLAFGLQMTLKAHEFGGRVRKAQEESRNVLQRITAEMRTSAALPTTGTGQLQVPSGVLWPDSYGVTTTGFYALEQITQADGKLVHRSKNRLIFTRPKTDIASTAFDASQAQNYIFVEYLVPQAPLSNRIYRKIHTVSTGVGVTAQGVQFDATNQRWSIIPAYFTNNTGLVNTQEVDQIVARLPGDTDEFEFNVAHQRYYSEQTGAPATEAGYNTTFDRTLFTVEVTTRTKFRGDPNKTTTQSVKAEARLQSGR